jgi:hypothetical protein
MIVDWDETNISKRENLNNDDIIGSLQDKRPSWSKVRWVHVEGIDWNVLKVVSKTFGTFIHAPCQKKKCEGSSPYHGFFSHCKIWVGLHPLSIEDVVHTPQRVKADHFQNHLFISMLVCRPPSLCLTDETTMAYPLLKPRTRPMPNSSWKPIDIRADFVS